MYKIALIPGDGVGHEVVPAAQQLLMALQLPITFVELEAGWETFQKRGTALPEETLSTLHDCDGALFGAVSSPSHRVAGYTSPIIAMRKALNLYANLRPIISAPIPGSQAGINLLIVRENTEGLYVKQEYLQEGGDRAVAHRVITRQASERIAQVAFDQAQQRSTEAVTQKPLVTIVHKANVMSVTDGLFRESALKIAQTFPEITVEEQLVDSMIYRLIREPQRYDVVVAPNLYGDILSDAAAALVGGLGLVPSANVGDHFVLAEPVHGSAPDIAGRGVANPIATIRAAALLLQAIGEGHKATVLHDAVQRVLTDGPWTQDLGGNATCQEVTNAVVDALV